MTVKLPIVTLNQLNKLNNEAVAFDIFKYNILGNKMLYKTKLKKENILKRYYKTREYDPTLAHKILISSNSKNTRIALYLSDNKFKKYDDIIKNCSDNINIKPQDYKNWVSRLYVLRNKNKFVVDAVYCDNELYYRLHPPGTISKYDGATNMNRRVFIVMDLNKNIPIISYSSLEAAENYVSKLINKNVKIFESILHNIA